MSASASKQASKQTSSSCLGRTLMHSCVTGSRQTRFGALQAQRVTHRSSCALLCFLSGQGQTQGMRMHAALFSDTDEYWLIDVLHASMCSHTRGQHTQHAVQLKFGDTHSITCCVLWALPAPWLFSPQPSTVESQHRLPQLWRQQFLNFSTGTGPSLETTSQVKRFAFLVLHTHVAPSSSSSS